MGVLGLGLSLVRAVVWAVVRDDVKTAFGIAGFKIAFLLSLEALRGLRFMFGDNDNCRTLVRRIYPLFMYQN